MESTERLGWRKPAAGILIAGTLLTGFAYKTNIDIIKPITKLFVSNPSEEFESKYYSFFNNRLDKEKKQEIVNFINDNESAINLYSDDLVSRTNIPVSEEYDDKLLAQIDSSSKLETVLGSYYSDTSSVKPRGVANSIDHYEQMSKHIIKELFEKGSITEEGVKYIANGKNMLAKSKDYDYYARLYATKDLETRNVMLEEYAADTSKTETLYDWIEKRTLKNLGYDEIEIIKIKKEGFDKVEIHERIHKRMENTINLFDFYGIIEENKQNPLFVKAVIMQESKFNQRARSHVGAQGLMQLMPSTAKQYRVNPWDARQNVKGGTRLLSDLDAKFEEYTPITKDILKLASYNWGLFNIPHFMQTGKLPGETKDYITKVMGYYNNLKEI